MRRVSALLVMPWLLLACDDGGDGDAAGSADTGVDVEVGGADAADVSSAGDAADDVTPDVSATPPEVELNGVAYDPPACATWAAPGPWTVGQTTIEVDGSPVEVWYPGAAGSWQGAERASYDIRDWLPQDTASLVPDEAAPVFDLPAWRDVPAAGDGPFPLVLFSHGFSGYRMQSATLLAHIASWGYVVASPEHPERGLAQIVESIIPGPDMSAATITSLLDAMIERNASDDVFSGLIDTDRVVMTGHSAGGGTTLAVFEDARIDAAIVYAAGSGDLTPSGKPVLFLAGAEDGIIPISRVEQGYEASGPPRRLISMARTGHLAFSDLCAVGRDDGGILEIASEYGVEVPGLLLDLGSDGCGEDAEPVEVAWPLIHHVSVAFLAEAVGDEAPPAGWSDDVATCFSDLIDVQRADVP